MSFFKDKIKVHEEALDVAQILLLTTLGHYVGKNNADWIDDMESWYAGFQKLIEMPDVNEAFQHAMHTLIEKCIDDEFVQLQVETLVRLLEINLAGPVVPEEILKYKKIVDSFMAGVKTVK